MRWKVPVEMGVREKMVAARLQRVGRFYVFLREIRHELFDEEFERELEAAYKKHVGPCRCRQRCWRWSRCCKPTIR
jgi:hypothetical protein